MDTIKDLLLLAFKAGSNSGYVECAHQLDYLKGKDVKTFDDFCEEPAIIHFLEEWESKLNPQEEQK